MIENRLLKQLLVMNEVKNFKVVSYFWDLEECNQVLFGNLILAGLDKMDWKIYWVE